MEKKEKRLLKELEKNNCINLNSFLISYCGIWNDALVTGKISHNDMKFLFPYLKKVSFEHALKNIKDVYVGNIVLVKDSYGHIAPYINPKIREVNDIEVNEVNAETIYKEGKFEKAIELENLSIYELAMLRKKYKEERRVNEYRKICRIIKKRKDNGIEIYHKKKEKIIMKGRLQNDEY